MSKASKKFVPLAVVCPGCGQSYHRTTPKFDPERAANGTMFELHPYYGPGGENWTSFPKDSAVMGSDLTCPGCGAPYPGAGTRVKTRPLVPTLVDELQEEREEAEADPEVIAHREATAEKMSGADILSVEADILSVEADISEENAVISDASEADKMSGADILPDDDDTESAALAAGAIQTMTIGG